MLVNGDKIYLRSFKSSQIETFIDFVRANGLAGERIHATGGGAHKYADLLEREFAQSGTEVVKHDEMASMVGGLSFILNQTSRPTYTLAEGGADTSPTATAIAAEEEEKTSDEPKLLVSIGSGVSMIKVEGDFSAYQRVSGTMIGGGTLVGLSSLLTGFRDFDAIIDKAQTGQNASVDMTVGDIYGANSPFKELREDLLASSFAKAAQGQASDSRPEDVLNSLVTMISFNIGQLAYFTAKLHGIRKIYFVGSFVRPNNILG